MSTGSISSIYSNLYQTLISRTTSSDGTSTNSSSSGTSSLTDILELGSSKDDLSAYLNYNSNGNYSNITTLLDYLTVDDDGTNLYRSNNESANSLFDLVYPSGNEDSGEGIFDSLINAKSKEIENVISMALEKLESKGSGAENGNSDNEE